MFRTNTITEADLTDFARNKAIKRFTIIQSSDINYSIVIQLTWKEGDWKLITARGNPREWSNLDRLVRHIQEKYKGIPPQITLSLFTND